MYNISMPVIYDITFPAQNKSNAQKHIDLTERRPTLVQVDNVAHVGATMLRMWVGPPCVLSAPSTLI